MWFVWFVIVVFPDHTHLLFLLTKCILFCVLTWFFLYSCLLLLTKYMIVLCFDLVCYVVYCGSHGV